MIPVRLQPEPGEFDATVRQPGKRALSNKRKLNKKAWSQCLRWLYESYNRTCSYLAIYIPEATGARTADHYCAKSSAPELRYEWANLRLACSLMNSRKQAFDDVLDPFEIGSDWFVLEFSFLQVLPSSQLPFEQRSKIQSTIDRLQLNCPECRSARERDLDAYLKRDITFNYLTRTSPFLAQELMRQGLAKEP